MSSPVPGPPVDGVARALEDLGAADPRTAPLPELADLLERTQEALGRRLSGPGR